METLHNPQHNLLFPTNCMYSVKLQPKLFFHTCSKLSRTLCTSTLNLNIDTTQQQIQDQLITTHPPPTTKKTPLSKNNNSKVEVNKEFHAQLKENWLASLSCPFPETNDDDGDVNNLKSSNVSSKWVIGIDPDLSGALAVLKTDDLGCSAQVFDSPHLKALVGKRARRRLDVNAIVKLLRSFGAPIGTTAYIEQSIPYPQDGKQGWWSGGFGYGLWIGVLVASGFSVVPVPSLLWKNEFELSGSGNTKDDSRRVASTLFPSVSSLLKRKKDHGRAEALLIAAYGKGVRIKSASSSSFIGEELLS